MEVKVGMVVEVEVEEGGICAEAGPGYEKVVWVGFDCGRVGKKESWASAGWYGGTREWAVTDIPGAVGSEGAALRSNARGSM